MKKLLFTITLCVATTTSIAMELEKPKEKSNILAEITCIDNPLQAHYLTENRILINARNGCSIVDSSTNKEIKRIFDVQHGWASCIAVHPHKTKFALAACHFQSNPINIKDTQQKITIYNAKTYDIEHTINWDTIDGTTIERILFSPLEDAIATSGNGNIEVILYNYSTKNITHINVPEAKHEHYQYNEPRDPIVAFHPTQPLMCLAWKTVYIHDLTTSTRKGIVNTLQYHDFCEYSPDGSFIAMGTTDEISCIKPDHIPHFTVIPQKYTYFEGARSDQFFGMAMHPNGNIIMILSRTAQGFLTANYYDIKTSECITKIRLSLKIPLYYTCLSFSPSRKKLLMVAVDRCAELKVPFKVFYKNITKKQLSYLLFLIKNYTSQCDAIEMPQDINILITKTLLELYKRQ